MQASKKIESAERRAFIKKAGSSVGAVGAVAIGLSPATAAAASTTGETPGRQGYRETEHVKRAYAAARF